MAPINEYKYETFNVTFPKPFVAHVELYRPNKLNAINKLMWKELGMVFNDLNNDPNCRSIVLSAAGKIFCAGIDLTDFMSFAQDLAEHDDLVRKARFLEQSIKSYQDSVSAIENCVKPVIVAVHAACVGGGVDIMTAGDIRYSTNDAWFQVKEVDVGMAADVGTLQRLPKVIGNQSLVRELCFTGRKMDSREAFSSGLVSEVFKNKEDMISAAIDMADIIAHKSPVAIQATKKNLIYSYNRLNQDGLDHIRLMNTYLLQSDDFLNAVMIQASSKGKDQPIFSKL